MKYVSLLFAVVLFVTTVLPLNAYAMSQDSFNKSMKKNSSQLNKVSSKLSKLSNQITKQIRSKYGKAKNKNTYLDDADAYVKEYVRILQEAADKAEALVKEFENK
ncbi:MAG: hypothetical protein LBL00_06450 [Endomicrobium sp.]|jgi:type VII secretion effector (TIGR04197 family)|nr:hypothetical protein [Endomicrobium sp.]